MPATAYRTEHGEVSIILIQLILHIIVQLAHIIIVNKHMPGGMTDHVTSKLTAMETTKLSK